MDQLEHFSEGGYSYEDAEALAKFWGDASPYESKLRTEQNIIMGQDYLVEEALTEVGRR